MAKQRLQLLGAKELERTLKSLGPRVQRKVLRSAVSASATPVLKSAKQKAPKQSGLLKKSLGRKIITNKKRGSVTALVGPRRNVQGEHKGKLRKPSRYAHLVENGFIDAAGVFHPPQAFVNPALAENEGQALDIMRSKLAAGVVREAAKGAA